MLCWDQSLGSIGSHPRKDLRREIRKTRPRPTHRTAAENVSSSRNGWWSLGVRFSNYFTKFWLQRFPAVLLLIDALTYCDTIDTNVMELVLDNRQTAWRILRAPQYLLHSMPKLSGGNGTKLKEKTQRDNGQTHTQSRQCYEWMNDVTFVYYVPSPHMICINPYIFRYISIRITEGCGRPLLFYMTQPACLVFSLFE